jgi:TetR/AcrR family transcriptional regulator
MPRSIRATSSLQSKSRRSPSQEERVRDADRTKRKILDAAAAEFAAKGFSGARVDAIAKAAGVNKQLITYYFDGKEGLYRSVVQQCIEAGPSANEVKPHYATLIASIFDSIISDPVPTRLLLWQALESADSAGLNPTQDVRIRQNLNDIRARQRSRELSSDYDAEFILLVLMASLSAPIALPHVLKVVSGGSGESRFLGRYSSQLQRLFAVSQQ